MPYYYDHFYLPNGKPIPVYELHDKIIALEADRKALGEMLWKLVGTPQELNIVNAHITMYSTLPIMITERAADEARTLLTRLNIPRPKPEEKDAPESTQEEKPGYPDYLRQMAKRRDEMMVEVERDLDAFVDIARAEKSRKNNDD